MAGNRKGGKQASATNKRLYGDDFYKRLGAKGGKRSRGGGFGQGEAGKARARVWGKLGGQMGSPSRTLPLSERAKKRQEFLKTHEHLLKVHEAANAGQKTESRLG